MAANHTVSNGLSAFPLIIDNQDITTEETFTVNHPITGDVVHLAPAATVQHADMALQSAEMALESWGSSTPIERRQILNRAATIMQERKEELINAMVRETGAKRGWAEFNVKTGLGFIEEAAGMASQITGEVLRSNEKGVLALALREPCGIVVGIAPWNAPIILGIRAFITPLLCGNTVILKASESSPYTQYLLVECFRQAGLPAGALNILCCPRDRAAALTKVLVQHDAVRKVNFTGSTAVGRIIARLCAEYLKPVVLELGGKASLLILEDANLEAACNAAVFGALMHQGQICMSTERIIVHASVAQKFKELLKEKFDKLYAADPKQDDSAPLSSLVTLAAAKRVHNLLTDAISKGATIVAGKCHFDRSIIQPVALGNVDKSMDIYYQESFGPSVSLFEFNDVEEAIRLANDTEYGLVSSVFSENLGESLRIARKIKTGSCHINGPTIHDEPHFPLGGEKSSGYGRFGGLTAIREFTTEKVVTLGNHNHKYPF